MTYRVDSLETPILELYDSKTGEIACIWADGRVKGFSGDRGVIVVVNKVPRLVNEAYRLGTDIGAAKAREEPDA